MYQYTDQGLAIRRQGEPELFKAVRENNNMEVYNAVYLDQDSGLHDVNCTDPMYPENSCLHEAVNKGNLKIVKLLLKAGADPNKENRLGFTPIHFITNQERGTEILFALHESGADLERLGPLKSTILDRAVARKDTSMVAALLKLGANPHSVQGCCRINLAPKEIKKAIRKAKLKRKLRKIVKFIKIF